MKSALFRSAIAGIASLLLWAAAEFAAVTFRCPDRDAWTRVHSGASTVVMDRGEQIARPGDAIFTCETPHSIGPFMMHRDLACYCAPREANAARISEVVGGSCALDSLEPTPDDAGSACRYGRCSNLVDLSAATHADHR